MRTMKCCIDKAEVNHSGKDRFEVRGWIYSKKGREIQAIVQVDNKHDLPYKIVHVHRPDVQKALKLEDDSEKLGFIIYIKDISKLWNSFEELEISFTDSEQTIQVFKIKFEKIRKMYAKNLLKYNVDSAVFSEDKILVRGWSLYKGLPCHISVWDNEGKEITCTVEQEERPDVNCVLSIDETVECGFTVEIPKKYLAKGNITLLFQKKDAKAKYTLTARKMQFENSRFGRYYQQLGPKRIKGNIRFIANHGIHEFRKELDKSIDPFGQGYGYWAKQHKVTKAELKREAKEQFSYEPLISIVIPLYNTPLNYLQELLDSITGQTYTNWQLCLADGSPNDQVKDFLEKKYKKETRITYQKLKKNGGISENTNAALQMARGEFIMLSDHDDVLEKNALYEIVKAINSGKKPDVIYTDEDKVSMDGKEYFDPHFKPDFNWEMFRCNNYICHIFVVSKKIVDEIGEFRKEFDGAQDYDFILRCCEKAKSIYHIPKVLYHWRSHPNSTAGNPASKMYAYENGRKALEAHYERMNIEAEVTMTPFWGRYRSKLKVQGEPLVSIIIPNKDHIDDLDRCLKSVYEKSTYRNFEVLVVENNSEEQETFAYYAQIQQARKNLQVLYWKKEFNYAAINNYAVPYAKGEYLLFLNNDVEVITPDWMEEMLGYCQRDDVGIVGAKLYYPNDTIQHAGIILGMGADHTAGHVLYGVDRKILTYGGRSNSTQDMSAVTAACMMVKKSVHEEINGFDEKFKVAYNDVDYCLRVRQLGKLVVFHAFAELYHYESKSRGMENTREKQERFQKEAELFRNRWKELLEAGDPYYNPNLTLEHSDCSLKW